VRCGPAAQPGEERYGGVRQFTRQIAVATRGKGLYEITRQVAEWVAETKVSTGLLTAFIRHTSASLVVQENADPDVVADLAEFFGRLVRESDTWYRHDAEGPDDMTSHIRSALTQTSVAIPVVAGRLAFGTWQGLFVFEHRAAAHQRLVALHLMGDGDEDR
jgi:secondary thiamine-phosphate synthase enzyme